MVTRRLADVVTAPRSTVSGYVICIRSMCDGCFVYDVKPAGFNYKVVSPSCADELVCDFPMTLYIGDIMHTCFFYFCIMTQHVVCVVVVSELLCKLNDAACCLRRCSFLLHKLNDAAGCLRSGGFLTSV